MLADLAVALGVLTVAAGLGELAGELALGIVRAGDESTVAAAAQAQPPFPAFRAEPRVGAILTRREQVVRKELVERFCDFAGLALHHLVGLGFEVLPEGFED